MVMSDRLAVMSAGRIEQVGRPEDVYDRPATRFVAGFLGASNLMPGEVVGRGPDGTDVRLDHGDTVRLPPDAVGARARSVMVGVRPEKLVLADPDEAVPAGWASVDGDVSITAYVGVSHQYSVSGPGGLELTVYAQNLRGGTGPGRGDRVRLMWDLRHSFVLSEDAPEVQKEEEHERA